MSGPATTVIGSGGYTGVADVTRAARGARYATSPSHTRNLLRASPSKAATSSVYVYSTTGLPSSPGFDASTQSSPAS